MTRNTLLLINTVAKTSVLCVSFLLATFFSLHGQNVAVMGSPGNSDWLDDVQTMISSCGNFDSVDAINLSLSGSTPSVAALSAYDAVLVFSDAAFYDPIEFGDNLADYVDAGGRVVLAAFANASVEIVGRFATDEYWVILPDDQENSFNLSLGTINNPTSPLVSGVNSFSGGSSSFHGIGSLHPDAVSVADYTNGRPLIATRMINGVPRLIFLLRQRFQQWGNGHF